MHQHKPVRASVLEDTTELNVRPSSKDLVPDIKKTLRKLLRVILCCSRNGALLAPKIHGVVSTLPAHT